MERNLDFSPKKLEIFLSHVSSWYFLPELEDAQGG
jgi:hypothetical protein